MEDLGAVLNQIGGNVESAGRILQRRRRDFTLNELESLRQTLLSNAGTLEAIIRLQKCEMERQLAEVT